MERYGVNPHVTFGKQPLLHIAAENGYTEIVKLLIDKYHLNPHEKGDYGYSVLHWAASGPRFFKMRDNDYYNHYNLVMMLIDDYKLSPYATDNNYGYSALHCAARAGFTDVVKLLIDRYKADPHKKSSRSRETVLYRAAGCSRRACVDLVRLLIDTYGVNPHAKSDGNTALHAAAHVAHYNKGEVMWLLIDHYGLNPNAKDRRRETVLDSVSKSHYDSSIRQRLINQYGAMSGEGNQDSCVIQ
ncbi:ankyrin repeat domain-containing protein [Sansalvadorimonas verongulae]|nr:ankyrin repeat domain-containing protein [Sansalvadorimonas verongulae]